MLSMPAVIVTIADKNLENYINLSATRLTVDVIPSSEIIVEILDAFEKIIQQYSQNERKKYLSLLNAKTPIKTKKILLYRLLNDTHQDIGGIANFLGYFNDIFAKMNKEEIPAYRCSERFLPVFDFLNDVLNEMNRINAYEDGIKDVLKQITGRMHVAFIDFFFSHKNYLSTIYHLQEKITIADTMVTERLKNSILDPSDVYILVMNYLECRDYRRIESILRLERERCVKIPHLYNNFCQELSKTYSVQEDYPQAIKWINEALSVDDSDLLHIVKTELMKANAFAIDKHFSAKEREFHLGQELEKKRSHHKPHEVDYSMMIVTAIADWPSVLIAKLKKLTGKYSFDFEPGKLIVHRLSRVGVTGLTKVFDVLNILEQQYIKSTQEIIPRHTEQAIPELASSLAALEISTPVACSFSSTPSCSTDPIAQDTIKPAMKRKTRGKADKRKQREQKISTRAPSCDAERYGFSGALFGMHKFNECRMRGDSNRLFYVVSGNMTTPNERGDHYRKFARLMAEPKIVPPCGEEGFKWMEIDGKQVLVGKALDTKKRLFPRLAQGNDQGAVAFLYGTIVNTKRGIPSQSVKHYASVPKGKTR